MDSKEKKETLINSYASKKERNLHYALYLAFAPVVFVLLGNFLHSIEFADDGHVELQVKARVHANDIFQVFYVPVTEPLESEENSVKVTFEGKPEMQVLTFRLPDSIPLKNIRIDLGQNTQQKQVEIDHIILSYNGETYVLLNKAGQNLFTPNEYIKNQAANVFALDPVNDRYDPFLYSHDLTEGYDELLKSRNSIAYPFFISLVLTLSVLVYLLLNAVRLFTIRAFYTLASCFFIVLLLSPTVTSFTGLDGELNQEKRRLAERPVLTARNAKEYPRLFEAFYNDNFGLRNLLVNIGSKVKYHLFASSTVPHRASVGKDGWLFLNGKQYNVTPDLTAENLFTEHDLWLRVRDWESRRDTLAAAGIRYYRAFWPDKHVIYPDMLPFDMKAICKDTVTRMDQALDYLKRKNSTIILLDVRPVLLEARKTEQIYFKYDSHWNARGALLAYNALASLLSEDFPEIKPFGAEDTSMTIRQYCGCDLSNLLGLGLCEPAPSIQFHRDVATAELPNDDFPEKTRIFHNPGSSTELEILFFRDSFTEAMIPYLNQHFRKVTLIWDAPFDIKLVRKVHPNLVVEAFASRYF